MILTRPMPGRLDEKSSDPMSLPTEARMNYPGKPAGNWQWRFTTGEVTPELVARLGETSALYCRHRDSDQVPK